MRARMFVAMVVAAVGFTLFNAWNVSRAYSVAQEYAHVMLPPVALPGTAAEQEAARKEFERRYVDYWAGVGRAGVTEAWRTAISREIVVLTVAAVVTVLVARRRRAV
jgi:hypothetical protein